MINSIAAYNERSREQLMTLSNTFRMSVRGNGTDECAHHIQQCKSIAICVIDKNLTQINGFLNVFSYSEINLRFARSPIPWKIVLVCTIHQAILFIQDIIHNINPTTEQTALT